jgi:hypothetical protein
VFSWFLLGWRSVAVCVLMANDGYSIIINFVIGQVQCEEEGEHRLAPSSTGLCLEVVEHAGADCLFLVRYLLFC